MSISPHPTPFFIPQERVGGTSGLAPPAGLRRGFVAQPHDERASRVVALAPPA
ncbi:unnamed protein product, partial [Closterium sp. Yama58-4]